MWWHGEESRWSPRKSFLMKHCSIFPEAREYMLNPETHKIVCECTQWYFWHGEHVSIANPYRSFHRLWQVIMWTWLKEVTNMTGAIINLFWGSEFIISRSMKPVWWLSWYAFFIFGYVSLHLQKYLYSICGNHHFVLQYIFGRLCLVSEFL